MRQPDMGRATTRAKVSQLTQRSHLPSHLLRLARIGNPLAAKKGLR
jgi:hypothetical protein